MSLFLLLLSTWDLYEFVHHLHYETGAESGTKKTFKPQRVIVFTFAAAVGARAVSWGIRTPLASIVARTRSSRFKTFFLSIPKLFVESCCFNFQTEPTSCSKVQKVSFRPPKEISLRRVI